MHVKEINEVKKQLEQLKNDGLVADWELPYENILTRISAAIFFLTPVSDNSEFKIWHALDNFPDFSFRLNQEKKLSSLMYQITFSKEEKGKNLQWQV